MGQLAITGTANPGAIIKADNEIGYDDEAKGMDYKTCKIEVVMDSQSSDIALGTNGCKFGGFER